MMTMRSMVIVGLVAAVAPCEADTLVDMGYPHMINLNGVPQYFGLSSGKSAEQFPQRWAASPFKLDTGATINEIIIDWEVPHPSVSGATIEYIIWKRTNLDRPVDGDQVKVGTLGPYDYGTDDPRTPEPDQWYHKYQNLNIVLPAGDYYFTMYSDGIGQGNITGLSYGSWLLGGEKQDPNLQRDGVWRSGTFPDPGFQDYAPAAIQPGPGMDDPLDRWNLCYGMNGTPTQSTVRVCPTSYSLLFGSLVSGTIADVCTSDNVDMNLRNGSTFLITQSPITIQFAGTTTKLSPTKLVLTCEYRVSLGGLTMRLDLFDYRTSNSYVNVSTRPGSLTDEVVTFTESVNASKFVSQTGQLNGQYRVRDDAPAFLAAWNGRVDEFVWDVTG